MTFSKSAWSKANQLSLGQVKVDAKSNEITAIPKLLEVLVLQGCPVTIDAMGCQRDIAAKIIEKGADYLLAVKGNPGCLEENAERTVRFTGPVSEWIEDDFGHGRIERRKREGYAAQNFSILNRIALNLIKHEQSKRRSVKGKRLDAG